MKLSRLTPLFLFTLLLICPQKARCDNPVATIMFYNVENLFDTVDDPLTDDNEFLPSGERRWTVTRFRQKLTNLARVINNTGYWEPPAVIGLCEVENRYVLEELVSHPALKIWNYQIVHKDSPDARGIDVAAIYRPDIFNPVVYRYFPPVDTNASVPSTREILYLSGTVAGKDTLHLFFNHWPSRYGGLIETRLYRERAAKRLRWEVDRLQEEFPSPRIIIMGDFNDQPDDQSMTAVLGAELLPGSDPLRLYNLSHAWSKAGKGTLKYQGFWNTFDQVIVSGAMLNQHSPIFSRPEDAAITMIGFLLIPDERNTGLKLNRTYEGYRYAGGYSDHLPINILLRSK